MANNIALQTLLAEALDKKLVASAKTSAMEANAAGIKYNGGNKFQFAKITFGDVEDLDYDKNEGYSNGSVVLEYETKTFKKDWGKSFLIDAMDVDESNFIATATNVLGEFERTVLVPAVDKFRFAEIAALAEANTANGATVGTYTAAATGVLAGLRGSINTALTGTGLSESDLVAYVSRTFYNALTNDKDVQKVVNINGSAIDLNSNVKTVDGVELHVVDDAIIGVAYIVCYKKAPIAIVKHEVQKIITPAENQTADAYRINVRVYHTLEIKDNEYPAVVVMKNA